MWTKLGDSRCTKLGSFWQKVVYYVYHFWHTVSAILKEVVDNKMMLRVIACNSGTEMRVRDSSATRIFF